MEIRKLTLDYFDRIEEIYAYAREFMRQTGNPNQWQDRFPTVEMTLRDIENGDLYGLFEGDELECVFAYIFGHDPTYDYIFDGQWLDEEPYGVVHRIASSFNSKGAGRKSIEWALRQCGNLRIDTHEDNKPMQGVLKKIGFEYCGKILTHDGTERVAFQKKMNYRQDLLEQLREFRPYNEQEENDRKTMISLLENVSDIYERTNDIAHMTASAWIVNRQRNMILMAYHNIYDSFSWLGGHADGDENLLGVALREVREESGLKHGRELSDRILSLEILTVDGHEKKGRYVSSHLHVNVTYLIEADSDEELTVKPDENKALRWFSIDESIAASNEKWFRERIYSKLNARLYQYLREEQHEKDS